jgi:hypothetical protein
VRLPVSPFTLALLALHGKIKEYWPKYASVVLLPRLFVDSCVDADLAHRGVFTC